MMTSAAPALLLPGARLAVARPGADGGVAAPPLRLHRPARARFVLAAARTPPLRSFSARCAPKTAGSFFAASASAPGGGGDDDVHGPALDALMSAVADAFRPLLENLKHVCTLKGLSDANDYNVGMFFGLFTASVGCYQLFKIAPSVLLDVVLGYLFYKLSVVSSQVHRQGFANDLITRIKFAIAFVMITKGSPSEHFWLGFIRTHAMFVYISTFVYDICGWKEYGRYDVSKWVEILRAKLVGVLML